ncbi:CidA/LrgA family protein [Pseudooceanicola sp. HF7]|uniref:CidA/LrgA family protein n=1 Tax=Pseudooceanicola sp. HF7 TaxID=2721560 RepID=UPI00143045A3|nr:CidA/LrgA family protein [Pseudooceanicola sp. HF7]NIZ10725.1 CidA/LrgA family protein [Pseudooceanicola sp. HF7]
MIRPFFLILCFQLAGEVIARGSGLPLPGPVLGMALLAASFLAWPALFARLRDTANGLLAHLPLLFVPAGVGYIQYLDLLRTDGWRIMLVLVASTALAIAACALTFQWLLRLTRTEEDTSA